MKENSWVCTLVTQLSLCIAVYVALNTPEKRALEISAVDVYFTSVGGGFRLLDEQTLLLEQMVKVVKTYKVQFVINISELGEYDPLLTINDSFVYRHRGTLSCEKFPGTLPVPRHQKDKEKTVERIRMPYGQTLDIIALDTKLLQNPSSVPGKDQLQWLMRTLKKSDAHWKIVVGFHQLFTYDYNMQKIKEQETTFRPLLSTLLWYGVVSISFTQSHPQVLFLFQENISSSFAALCDVPFVRNRPLNSIFPASFPCIHLGCMYEQPNSCRHVQREATQLINTGPTYKGPYFISLNQNMVPILETVNGFLVHSITSLEMMSADRVSKFKGLLFCSVL